MTVKFKVTCTAVKMFVKIQQVWFQGLTLEAGQLLQENIFEVFRPNRIYKTKFYYQKHMLKVTLFGVIIEFFGTN